MDLKQYFGKHRKPVVLIAGLSFLLLAIFASAGLLRREQPPASLSEVAAAIEAGQVASVQDRSDTGQLTVIYRDGRERRGFRDTNASLLSQLRDLGVSSGELAAVEFEIVRSRVTAASSVMEVMVPVMLLGVAAFLVVRMNQRTELGGGKSFRKGAIPDTAFTDVAGLEEAVAELRDVVTFLRDGDAYAQIGAKTPHGILLVGEPGTGKTLLARAVAGEAGVPFFPISGAEFVEVFVGVGARRVRSLFTKARKSAPCIVFIDEIDAVGRTRHGNGGGGEMEQDQTLNQLLVEMDGFSPKENVIVLAATNRADVLDPALLRAGRFDRRVQVEAPDVAGREAILKVHVRSKKLSAEVNLADVARSTPGLVGADLESVVNEAAILAVRAGHSEITRMDLEAAVEKVITGGVEHKSRVISVRERKIIAYHEAGHAVVMAATEACDPVYKISIVPRGRLGGFTMALPEEDRLLVSKNQMLARITGLMAGRAAEEIFFQDITTGAANDLSVATDLAEDMVMRLGMGAAGLRVFPRREGYLALGNSQGAPRTAEEIDTAVETILSTCYAQAKNLLCERRELVCQIATELLETESMSRERFYELIGMQPRQSTDLAAPPDRPVDDHPASPRLM
jgi:cell division protease FtsH